MNTSLETSATSSKKLSKKLRQGLATTALSLTAAMAPAIATARAGTASTEKLHKHVSTKVLQKESSKRLDTQQSLAVYNGVLLEAANYNTGGTSYVSERSGSAVYANNSDTSDKIVISHPVVVFRGNPKDEFSHQDLTNGDYAFGKTIDRSTGKPQVKLITFSPSTMQLIPWGAVGDPMVESVVFQSDKIGNIKLDEPMTSLDAQGTPLVDAAGNAWVIGLEINNPKG